MTASLRGRGFTGLRRLEVGENGGIALVLYQTLEMDERIA
jgi:hypothetical protein